MVFSLTSSDLKEENEEFNDIVAAMQKDLDDVRTENFTQSHEINKLNERISTLEGQALLLPSKEDNEVSYLRKRSEADSYEAFDIEENYPQKTKNDVDLLSKRIMVLSKKHHSKY